MAREASPRLYVKAALHRTDPSAARTRWSTMRSSRPCAGFDLGLAGYVSTRRCRRFALTCRLTLRGWRVAEANDEQRGMRPGGRPARVLVGPLTAALEREGSARAYFDIDLPLVVAPPPWSARARPSTPTAEPGASTGAELEGLRAQIYEAGSRSSTSIAQAAWPHLASRRRAFRRE